MYRISILYTREEGKRFDVDYYRDRHMALVKALLGPFHLRKTEVDEGIAGSGGSPSPFVAIGHLYFDDIEDFRRGMKEAGSVISGDVPNYTDLKPTVQISRVH